ncbi:aldehyde dehydrogenase family protein [Streptomyces gibsoniae]|uniref:Aldehyde dehydrogenase family protein n=1 Tax=Streptomyces gibsoniae TaxID=3075529 RepID=A0ABU2TWS7_9ACTN|nr:aldehyde dehydrogenase family protein [Streptomyces sp. DSM 41699]MDT0465422.1 aldehyde dehydrogenase family protein [Streptomyces sp. DSM 41699]
MRTSEAPEFGMVGRNRPVVRTPPPPFGGVEQPGVGHEGGYDGLPEFTEDKDIASHW